VIKVVEIDRKLETDELTPEVLDYIIEKIIKHIKPLKIVLFGSFARGEQKKGSDLDLLIIVNSNEERNIHIRRKIDDLMWGREFALDLLVRKPKEVEINLEAGNLFYTGEIFQKGRVLYENG
jgi:uncharacterized protein